MTALRTTTTCHDCGNQIPESLLADALCVRCRYPSTKKTDDRATEYSIAADEVAFEQFNQPTESAPANDGLDLEPVLAFLISDNASAQAIGERVLMLSYFMPLVDGRPDTTRELGKRLGCTHTGARKKVSRLKAGFIKDLREIVGKSFQPKS